VDYHHKLNYMTKYLNGFVVLCLISFLFFTMRLYWENTYFPRGIFIVQFLLILFQIVNRFSMKCFAIVFYLFIILYSTFGDIRSAVPYNFSNFLFPLMVTVCKQANYRLMYLSEIIVLIILMVYALVTVAKKRTQL